MMKKLHRLRDLTEDELRRVHHTLSARFGVETRGNVLEIGFGIAEKRGELDASRADAFIFYVSRKRSPRAKRDRIPKIHGVRIKRQRRFILLELPTDVVLFDSRQTPLTGRQISHGASPRRFATAGAVVLWRVGFTGPFHWCVTTAGHHFWDRRGVPEHSPQVTVRCDLEQRISGRLILRSLPADGVDIALVEVSRTDLIHCGLIPSSTPVHGQRLRSISDIRRDELRSGTTHPESLVIRFEVTQFFYEFKLVPELGILFDVLKVRSPVNNAFKQGRSGTLWIIDRQAACHQSIGWSTSDPRRTFVDGAGQSLHYALRWVQSQLAAQHQTIRGNVQIRLISAL